MPIHAYPLVYSALVLGMTIGNKDVTKMTGLKEDLVSSGLIHVVVVSGYNITLAAQFFDKISKGRSLRFRFVVSLIGMTLYALLTGFEPPIQRALLMHLFVMWAKYYGRGLDTLRNLLISSIIIVLCDVTMVLNRSFLLSFSASLGLILYGGALASFIKFLIRKDMILIDDLASTLAAQIFVIPLLSLWFGRVSSISIFVNCLTLWAVVPITILGFVSLLAGFLSFDLISNITLILLHPFLDFFISVIRFVSKLPGNLEVRLGLPALVFYYSLTLPVGYYLKKRVAKDSK